MVQHNHYFNHLMLSFFLLIMLGIPMFASEGQTADESNLFSEISLNRSQLTERQLVFLDSYQSKPTTEESRMVRVNFELLKKGKSVNLNLFPGEEVLLSPNRVEQRSEQAYIWKARSKEKNSGAVLTVKGDEMFGFIYIGLKKYEVMSLERGLHVVIRTKSTRRK